MKNKLLLMILSTVCITVFAKENSKIVTDKDEFIAAVSPNSPFTTVYVKGEINDLENVQLKENLMISGYDNTSKLIAKQSFPKNDLLLLSKNDRIENITLIVPEFYGAYAIRNHGTSVGSLYLNNIKTNGEISIMVTDGSQDSLVAIENTQIELNNAPSTPEQVATGIEFLSQYNSLLTIQKLKGNTIKSIGEWNMGIYSHAYSGATIKFQGNLENNTISTQGKESHAIYNYANQGIIYFYNGIVNNIIKSAVQSNGIFNYSYNNGYILIKGGISNNKISTEIMLAYGIANQSQKNGKIKISTSIQDNIIFTTGTACYGFYNCAGLCDRNGDEITMGTIDLTEAKINNNKITTTYDNTSAIENIANTPGSIVNFGSGSASSVETMLGQNNSLTCPPDAKTVYNYFGNGGIIN